METAQRGVIKNNGHSTAISDPARAQDIERGEPTIL